MIKFNHKGNFSKTIKFLSNSKNSGSKISKVLNRFGEEGVRALSKSTPVDSGLTSKSWYYKITETNGTIKISWCNSNIVKGVPIAVLLQYGHGTKNGGWVEGRDYINPTMKPIFDKIAEQAWREVSKNE